MLGTPATMAGIKFMYNVENKGAILPGTVIATLLMGVYLRSNTALSSCSAEKLSGKIFPDKRGSSVAPNINDTYNKISKSLSSRKMRFRATHVA